MAGSWGYGADTKSGGTVGSGLSSDSSVVSMVCSNASLVGVGDTLLIESEQVFVSDRAFAAIVTSALIDGALTADNSNVTVTVDVAHGILQGEIIQVDSERMFVSSVATNDLTVIRAYDGTTLAAHNNDTAIQINRTLTIERAKNGTTAATHADATAISVYEPPFDIVNLCVAESLAQFHQESAGWGRAIGSGEGAQEFNGRSLSEYRKWVIAEYTRKGHRMVAI